MKKKLRMVIILIFVLLLMYLLYTIGSIYLFFTGVVKNNNGEEIYLNQYEDIVIMDDMFKKGYITSSYQKDTTFTHKYSARYQYSITVYLHEINKAFVIFCENHSGYWYINKIASIKNNWVLYDIIKPENLGFSEQKEIRELVNKELLKALTNYKNRKD